MPMGNYKDFEDCVRKNQDKENPPAYCGEIKKKIEGRKKIGCAWKKKKKKAKLSGLAQIPEDYKKHKDGDIKKYHTKNKIGMAWKKLNLKQIGTTPKMKTLRFSAPMMNKYAILTVKYLREGDFRDMNGTPYFHPWETLEEGKDTYKGKYFYLDHKEGAGLEYGKIEDVYTQLIDGIDWVCAKIKIPEINITKEILDRIQNGLIKDVSSTHDIYAPTPDRTVKKITGKGISLVEEGEVEGAEVVDIKRNILNPNYVREVVKNLWKKN